MPVADQETSKLVALGAKTVCRQLITMPGRITRSARRRQLHLPRRWPWRRGFMKAIVRLRTLPALT